MSKLDLKFPVDEQQNIVIQGNLVKSDRSMVRANVSRLFDFTANGARPIAGADVRLIDRNSNFVELVRKNSEADFIYQFDGSESLAVETGQMYKLQVELPDGREYHSEWQILLPLPDRTDILTDSIKLPVPNAVNELVPGNFLLISTNTVTRDLTGDPLRLIWSIENCGVIISIRGIQFEILDGSKFATDYVGPIPLFRAFLIELEEGDGYCFDIIQQSLSVEGFEYWSKVREASVREASIFEPPAGQIFGNISRRDLSTETVYGYFSASEERRFRVRN